MEPKSRLEAILSAVPHGGHTTQDIAAIAAAVQWIAERDCPDGFGTYWHRLCVSLTQDTANDAMAIMRSIE